MDNAKTFGKRLRWAMIQAGFTSKRTPSGVNIDRLAEITQNSPQICRRYLRDVSLPGLDIIIKISAALDVRPAWLLFGGEFTKKPHQISISPALLRYLFDEALRLRPHFQSNQHFADFLLYLTEMVQQFDRPENEIKKIIQCVVNSVECFNRMGSKK